MNASSTHRVVIVGGGAGGLELAVRLGRKCKKLRKISVTLIDRNLSHLWKPLLHEVAAGTLDSGVEAIDYLALAQHNGFWFRPGKMIGLNRAEKLVALEALVDDRGRPIISQCMVPYDTLVLAIGSSSNDFDVPGVKNHCLFLDSRQQADLFHKMLLSRFLQLQYSDDLEPARVPSLLIAIIGAGATGVELAAELYHVATKLKGFGFDHLDAASPIKITLIEAAPRILQALPERLSRAAEKYLRKIHIDILTSSKALEVTEDSIILDSGRAIEAQLKIWTAGIKAPELLRSLGGLETNHTNQLLVQQDLTTTTDPDIFAFGDCAACPQPGKIQTVPPRSQAAHQQASVLTKSILRRLNGMAPLPFVYKDYGSLISLSQSSIGRLMGNLTGAFFIEGWLARTIYLSLYRSHQMVIHGSLRTLLFMTMDLLTRRTKPRMKLH
jgi:NADH:ubiquinone reductase (H+-translocating)